ncbi:hypothetical protein O6H91_17G047700 [Diphasiastrum complanatum]|uniref:Uncharacterized protein n=1 Tax=Diphasiastrum complanatum TaxID=34168 RepID=A0ACC2B6J1_DIPCM|nr:hypothetical protein O6H91_17G047700 [Diphasiastrum complanatum]
MCVCVCAWVPDVGYLAPPATAQDRPRAARCPPPPACPAPSPALPGATYRLPGIGRRLPGATTLSGTVSWRRKGPQLGAARQNSPRLKFWRAPPCGHVSGAGGHRGQTPNRAREPQWGGGG